MFCSYPKIQFLALVFGVYLLIMAGNELYTGEVYVSRAIAWQGDPIVGTTTASPVVKILRGCPFSRNFLLKYSHTTHPGKYWLYVGVELFFGLTLFIFGLMAGILEPRLFATDYDSRINRTQELLSEQARERQRYKS
jgi:hypothetical protein